LLKRCIPLIPQHGFTRKTIAAGVDLSETAISALFGPGDKARHALIEAWMKEGICDMKNSPPTMKDLLQRRLEWNKPVLQHLPEAFALLSSQTPLALLSHGWTIADEALIISQTQKEDWYTARSVHSFIYLSAELHQLSSPATADEFLTTLLSSSDTMTKSVNEVGLFMDYVGKGMKGILRSGGAF